MALDAIDMEAMREGSAITRKNQMLGRSSNSGNTVKRPPKTCLATRHNKDRWGNRA